MNLNTIVRGAIGVVNPPVTAWYRASAGYRKAADFTPIPLYAPGVRFTVQMQPISSYKDLTQISGITMNGEKRAIYVSAAWMAVDRPDQKGGDIVTLQDQSVWLVAMVLQNFAPTAGWVKVCVVKQPYAWQDTGDA